MEDLAALLEEDALYEQLELAQARESLAVYAGLHIPAEIEQDDLPRLHELSLPARYIPAQHHRLIIEKLEDVERGDIKRLMILSAPGSAKSSYASMIFPAWYLGKHSGHSVVCASQTQPLADRFGRRARNLVASQTHRKVFGAGLAPDQRAAGQWETEQGGEYFATGAQPFAGRRADLAVCDDLIRGREDADSKTVRNSTWEWFIGDLRPRLKPGAAVVYITCMTGDTPVLMADGSERSLREIRPGDRIGTYERGRVTVSTVLNWVNHGPDRVFAIRMRSGIVVKANARHPFLVEENGEATWQRTATLKKGSAILRVIGGNTEASSVLRSSAKPSRNPMACACSTTESPDGRLAFGLHRTILLIFANVICATVTGSIFKSMTVFSRSSEGCARSVSGHRKSGAQRSGCASIIATTARRFVGFCATIATSLLAMARQQKLLLPPLSTCEVTRDTVVEIVDGGTEDVFDIEVERTENFIAAGLVSSNTRWHEDDPAGRILPPTWRGESGWVTARDGEKWYVLCLVAVIETQEEEDRDPLNRAVGEIIWPEWFTPEMLAQEKRSQGARNWNALYQQKPRPDEGSIIKSHWWQKWPGKTPPKCEYVISVYDTAFEEGEEDDYTARTSWGIFWNEDVPDDNVRRRPTEGRYCAILLGRLKKKMEFPELRQEAWEDYQITKPDRVLIEKRVSGHSLIQELRRKGVPVMALAADKSKLARAHAATAVFEQGCIYYMDKPWAQEVIDDCAAATFRRGDPGNDIGDTVVHACIYLRRTFHLNLRDEEGVEENDARTGKVKAVGYGAR